MSKESSVLGTFKWGSVVVAALLFAYAGELKAATPPDTVLIAKHIDDVLTVDPAEAFESSGGELVGNLYDRLLYMAPDAPEAVKPGLAESWTADPDGVTFRFNIRAGVKFHSGNPVTADDVVYSFRRAVVLNKNPAFIIRQFGFTPENVNDAIFKEGANTVVLKVGTAVAPTFLYACLTAVVGSVVDSKVVSANAKDNDWGNGWLRANSAGSGPYRLGEWKPKESYRLEANPNYWLGAPKNRRVVVRHVPEASTQRLLLEQGDIDYARNLEKDQIAGIAQNKALAVDFIRGGGQIYLGLNSRNQYLGKPEVQEAMRYLVDYDGIATNLLKGTGFVQQTFLPIGFLGALDEKPFKLDVARAKALMAKAGLVGGFNLSVDVRNASPFIEIAQSLQATWAQVNIRLSISPADFGQILTKYRAAAHDLYLGTWEPDYFDPHTNASFFTSNPDPSDTSRQRTAAWRNGWITPEMTAATTAAIRERDTAKRVAAYHELQRRALASSPIIFLFQQVNVVARRSDVNGMVSLPGVGNTFYATIAK